MEFTDVYHCQGEIDRALDILRYLDARETCLAPVYATLERTMQQSEAVNNVLRQVSDTLGQTKSNFIQLVSVENRFSERKPVPLSKGPIPNKDISKHNTTQVTISGTGNEKDRLSQKRSLAAQSSAGNRRPTPRVSVREQPVSRAHNGPPFTSSMPRKRASLPTNPRNSRVSVGRLRPGSDSSLHPPERKRIRHNSNYPKPWLDPPRPSPRNKPPASNPRRGSIAPALPRRASFAPTQFRRNSHHMANSPPTPQRVHTNLNRRRSLHSQLISRQSSIQPRSQTQPPTLRNQLGQRHVGQFRRYSYTGTSRSSQPVRPNQPRPSIAVNRNMLGGHLQRIPEN